MMQRILFLFLLSLVTQAYVQAAQMKQELCCEQKVIDASLNEQMWQAIERNQIDVLRKLFSEEKIPDINAIEENDDGLESTALMKAVRNPKITQFLLDHGAQIDKKTSMRKETALMEAAYHGALSVVQLLINHHADVNSRDDFGFTPLIHAVQNSEDSAEKINMLLEHGADPNAQDNVGRTALMWAVFRKNIDAVQPLVAGGADTDIKDTIKNNKTVLDIARERGFGDEYQAAIAAGQAIRAQYNREVVEPMIVESIGEVDFPPELAGEVAEYANIDLNSQCRKRKR